MKFGEAVIIFKNINSEKYTLEEKINAIDVVMKAATINSVFKDDLCEVIRFLLSICTQPADLMPTNEDWFVTLTTEEKAKVIANETYSSAMMGAEITALPKEDEVRKWEMWLKQPHNRHIMKCPECGGTGKVDGWDGWSEHDCKVCDGKGYLTNDEWRKTCSMEEFATWLWKHFDHGEVIVLWEKYGCPMYKDDTGVGRADYTKTMKKWLKAPHTPNKQNDFPCNVKGCSFETRQACCGCPDYFDWKKQHRRRKK